MRGFSIILFLKVLAGIEEPDSSEHEVQLEQASWTEQLERIHGIIRKDQRQKDGAFTMMNPAPTMHDADMLTPKPHNLAAWVDRVRRR